MCQYANEEIKAKAKVKKVKGQKSSYPSFLSIINSLSIPKAFGTNLQSLRTRNAKPVTRTNGHRPKGDKRETRNAKQRSSLRNQAAFFMFGCVDNRKMHPQNIFRLSSNQIKTMSCSSYLPHVVFKILPKGCWQTY